MDNALIVRRYDALKADRANVESRWSDIDRYVLPLEQGSFLARADAENAKNWSSKEVWDSTAPIGVERLASMFYSGLISGRWLGVVFRDSKVNQDPQAKKWLEDCVDRMFDAIMSSNFPVEMASSVLNWVGYGNTCLTESLVDDGAGGWQGLDFCAHAVRDIFFEEDWRGQVYRVYRPLMWHATQIVSKFRDPADPAKPHPSIPEDIVRQAGESTDSGQKHEVVFCVYPRDGARPMSASERARAPGERPFGFKYVLRRGLVALGEEGGYYEMPTFVGRYWKSANSVWGFGPPLVALPTVKMLNSLMESVVGAAAKVVDPATLVTERGLMSNLRLGPGQYTTVRSLDDIAPYESKARFDVSETLLADIRSMIRKYFREDDITLKESPQMTATEAGIRDDRLNKLFGPQVRRIYHDVFRPVVQVTFNHMYREGQFDKPPAVVAETRPRMQIEFYGAFMRAQRSDEVVAIERILTAVYAAKKMEFRRAALVVKDDQAIREMGERLATPASMLRSEKEVDELEAEKQKLQQAAAEAQIQKTRMEAARAGAGAQETMAGMNGGGM